MKCSKCNTQAELKLFSTFQYHYCNLCKDEVSILKNEKKEWGMSLSLKGYIKLIKPFTHYLDGTELILPNIFANLSIGSRHEYVIEEREIKYFSGYRLTPPPSGHLEWFMSHFEIA